MKAKLAFVAGLAVGYVVGTRVGRRGYENLKKNARAVWEMDAVQETVQNLEGSIKDEAKDLGSRLVDKVSGGGQCANETADNDTAGNDTAESGKSSGAESGRRAFREKPSESAGQNTLPDVESDPALNDAMGQDWADEGGALPSGPAT